MLVRSEKEVRLNDLLSGKSLVRPMGAGEAVSPESGMERRSFDEGLKRGEELGELGWSIAEAPSRVE